MKNPILRILIGAILFSLVPGIVVSIIGLRLGWRTSTQFSSGFFFAGAIMIAIRLISFQGYSQRTPAWPPVHLDPADRSNLWAADISRGKELMILFGLPAVRLVLPGLETVLARNRL